MWYSYHNTINQLYSNTKLKVLKNVVHIYNRILVMERNKIGSFVQMRIDLESVIQSEVSQKNKCHILMHKCGIQKNGIDDLICKTETETQT